MATPPPAYITVNGRKIAFRHRGGQSPGVFFLGGFNSSMEGLKALAFEHYCREHERGYTRFDYSGHGISSGRFEDSCVGDWLYEATAVFDKVADKPMLVVGSSMGAWIGALLCQKRENLVAGLMGIAPAFDFTRDLIGKHLNVDQQKALYSLGQIALPSCYNDEAPYVITHKLIDEGDQHCLLDRHFKAQYPVHLVHGLRDDDVSWQTSTRFARQIQGTTPTLTLIKNGDHRLSSKPHLRALCDALNTALKFAPK